MELIIPHIENGEDFTFSIKPGDRALFLGPNGAGKSRLGAFIESELSNHIFHNNNNLPINDDKSIDQGIAQKQQEVEYLKSIPIELLAEQIQEHKNSPFHSFIPTSLSRTKILELLFQGKLHNHQIQFESNSFIGSIPPRSLDEIFGGRIVIDGIHIDVELMKTNTDSKQSIQKFKENQIKNIEQQIDDLNLKKLGFHKVDQKNIDKSDALNFCHRISGHRSLIYNQLPLKSDPSEAQKDLIGDVSHIQQKWNGKPTGGLQADFEKLLVALMSDEISASLNFKQSNYLLLRPTTKLDLVIKTWNELLPNRELKSSGADIRISFADGDYKLDQCSEGEKSIFYILGQCTMAPENSLIIIDEPEIHINKSILPNLFDKIESSRPDCAFIYITHDIDFSRSRSDSKIYIVKNYCHPNKWDAFSTDSLSEIPREIITRIAGSRKPILFCEGDESSIDNIYKSVYTEFTVIPVSSCKDVIALTTSFNNQNANSLHYVDCYGLIDGDNQTNNQEKIKRLDVGLIENIFLIPEIAEILYEEFRADWPGKGPYTQLVTSWAKRCVDWRKKNIGDQIRYAIESEINQKIKTSKKPSNIQEEIDLEGLKSSIESAIKNELGSFNDCLAKAENGNILPLLAIHRGKGLLSDLAKALGISGKNILIEKIPKIKSEKFLTTFRQHLPKFSIERQLTCNSASPTPSPTA